MTAIGRGHHIAHRLVVMTAVICVFFAHNTLQAKSPTELNFNVYLAEGYRQMAAVAARASADRQVVDYYRSRHVLAVRGRPLSPQQIDPNGLDPGSFREASFARKEL